jgi:phosphohistidine phosphatase
VRLILIRHADAGEPDPRRYPDDRSRPLTPDGDRQHRLIADGLARMGLTATHVLTSPLRRARETAELTARALGFSGAIEAVAALGDDFSAPALLERFARCPGDAVVVCVGHEPQLSRLAAILLHPDGTMGIALARSGVLALECTRTPAPGAARLLYLLPPRELLRLLGEPLRRRAARRPGPRPGASA